MNWNPFRSPSQHRSRSTSAALRQSSVMSGDQHGSGLTIGPNAWLKRKLHLRPQHRGVHLVTEEILAGLPELAQFQVTEDNNFCVFFIPKLLHCGYETVLLPTHVWVFTSRGHLNIEKLPRTNIRYVIRYPPGRDHAHPAPTHQRQSHHQRELGPRREGRHGDDAQQVGRSLDAGENHSGRDRLVPESIPFKHSCEGPDDMPAHAKACLLGSNLTLPICDGRVTLGTWQGVWLCEHRSVVLHQFIS